MEPWHVHIDVDFVGFIELSDLLLHGSADETPVGHYLCFVVDKGVLGGDAGELGPADVARHYLAELTKHLTQLLESHSLLDILGEDVGFVDVVLVLLEQHDTALVLLHEPVHVQIQANLKRVRLRQRLDCRLSLALVLKADESEQPLLCVMSRQYAGGFPELSTYA